MKKIITALALPLALALLFTISACSTMSTSSNTDIKFETDIDPKANFKGYNSYMWMGSAAILNDPDKLWNSPGFDVNAEVKLLIDNGLRDKKMTEASENPDVLVGYALGINMNNIEYKENPDKTFKTLEEAPKGALIIMMVDAKTGIVIWASSAHADIQGGKGDAAKQRLAYAIKSMMGSLPK